MSSIASAGTAASTPPPSPRAKVKAIKKKMKYVIVTGGVVSEIGRASCRERV